MKIAIQGHPTRGHEIIQIFESLGGKNDCPLTGTDKDFYYYIYNDSRKGIRCHYCNYVSECKKYTLEEFEKEFPFKIGDEVIFPVKIGWESGKVTGLTYIEDQLKYEVDVRRGGYQYVEPYKLSLYPMKKERNITLTLDKAKEWYKKGGELKEIALQAFSEKELNSLPRSWEEFCDNYPMKGGMSYIDDTSNIKVISSCDNNDFRDKVTDRNMCPSKKSAEAHLALIQLEQLRDCWRQGWVPKMHESVHTIKFAIKGLNVYNYVSREFLSFPTEEMAKEFLKCFKDLIEKAGDLI